jgi:hypothetical protein
LFSWDEVRAFSSCGSLSINDCSFCCCVFRDVSFSSLEKSCSLLLGNL